MNDSITNVKAKKHLGQHFLHDKNIAAKISSTLDDWSGEILEIGPGMGVLTKLLPKERIKVVEVDTESVDYLISNEIIYPDKIINHDFLKLNLEDLFSGNQFAVIGNFPYNISTQIVFKVIDNRHLIPRFSGMFQKEVAERIAMKPGTKAYGILSVLTQAFYEVKYEFSVPPSVFSPPPKVNSGVINLHRKENFSLSCDEKLFYKVVKTAFNTRRKMLRSSLRSMVKDESLLASELFTKRPEQLDYKIFVQITLSIQNG